MAKRIKIPFVLDLVVVTTADEIRKVEASDSVDRLHVFETSKLPWWTKLFFKATNYYDHKRDLWFSPFEHKKDPSYQTRLDYLNKGLEKGYTQDDVDQIVNLLASNAHDDDLIYAMVQVVNKRFFGKDIPKEICEHSKNTVFNLREAINPRKYKQAIASHAVIMDYCEKNLTADAHLVDVGHNIGEVTHLTAKALKTLKENVDTPIEELFTQNPLTIQVPRIATKASTIDGLINKKSVPGKTIFICKISEAAKETGDLSFTFAAGNSERVCVFQEFFLGFMMDVQHGLKN